MVSVGFCHTEQSRPGGIGAGSFELRGDGSLHEFIIHNAGPGLGPRGGLFLEARGFDDIVIPET